MRPLRIEMSGFAAFAEPTVVDLTGVTLAAILGPTGAGKSSIIDAITFALYGSVARYDHAGSVTPAICQASAEAKVLVTFEAGGVCYTAARRVARVGGTKEARLESDAGAVLASTAGDVTAAVKTVIGLDFAQFTKTVVLPQGRFAQFLHDKPADRHKALSQILDLEAYARVGGRARGIAAELTQRVALLEAAIEDSPTVAEAEALAQQAREVRAAADTVSTHVMEHQNLLAAATKTETAAAEAQARQSIAAAVAVPAVARAAATQAAAARTAATQAAAEADDARRRATEATEAAAELPTPEECQARVAACERASEAAIDLDRADAALADANAAAEAAETTAGAAAGNVSAAEAAEAAAQTLSARAAAAATSCVQPAILDRAEALHERRAGLQQRRDTATQHLADARQSEETARTQAEASAAEAAEARDSAHIHHLTGALTAGDDCPVCGQEVTDSPNPDPAPATAAAEACDQTTAAATADAAAHTDAVRAAAEAAAETESLDEMLAEVDNELNDLPTADEISGLRTKHRSLTEAAEEAATAAEDAAHHLKTVAAFATSARIEAAEAQAQAARAAAERAAAADKAADADAAAEGFDPEQAAETLRNARKLRDEANLWTVAAESAESAARAAESAASEAEAASNRSRDGYNTTRDQLISADFAPPAPAGDPLEDWEALAAYAAKAAEQTAEIADTARREATELTDRAAAILTETTEACEPHIDTSDFPSTSWAQQLSEAAARAETEAGTAKEAAQRRAEAETETAALTTERDVAAALGKHLQADGFERWRMHEAAADLTERASSVLLDLSGDRYELAPDNGTIAVIDHYNGGDSRTAKTLSGGETFLASLALALALAEETASTAGGLEALIIDEGFGSLDTETLDIAADGLEKLEAMGRMVCIVTHIPALADRMPVRFEVSRTTAGSQVARVDA